MAYFEVPLTPSPQIYQIDLAGVTYQLTFYWLNPAQCWTMDIADEAANNIACGIPLVTPTDLLGQLAYIGIDGKLYVQSDVTPEAVPTYENLGIQGHLFFQPNAQ